MAGNRGVYGEGYCLGECLFFLPIPKYMEGVRRGIRGSDSPPGCYEKLSSVCLVSQPFGGGLLYRRVGAGLK